MKKYEFTVTKPDGATVTFILSGVNLTPDITTTYTAQLQKRFPGATVTWKEVTP